MSHGNTLTFRGIFIDNDRVGFVFRLRHPFRHFGRVFRSLESCGKLLIKIFKVIVDFGLIEHFF
jgi:hypothetical protein